MTLDDIERAAIEAGYEEFTRLRKDDATTWRECFEGGLRAYERAMWRPIEEAPTGADILITDGNATKAWHIDWRDHLGFVPSRIIDKPTHFRPLPKREG